ncbi:MAG: hypothetical protein KJ645_03410, partial [Planctomycetes bacterium]|nr:hypothetical protein [Planctomycetota bacterium]
TPDKKCMVYENRPSICRFFRCSMHSRDIMRHLSSGSAPDQVMQRFSHHVIATRLTEEYITKNGSQWNKEDFFQALHFYEKSIERIPAMRYDKEAVMDA